MVNYTARRQGETSTLIPKQVGWLTTRAGGKVNYTARRHGETSTLIPKQVGWLTTRAGGKGKLLLSFLNRLDG